MKKIGLGLAIFILLVLFFIPNIVAYYIEREDESLIGRELTIKDIDINYFTGEVSIESLYLLEQNAKDTFAGFELLNVNVGIWSSIIGVYSIESIHLTNPTIHLIQYDSSFNFTDLIPTQDTTFVEREVEEDNPLEYAIGAIQVLRLNSTYTDTLNETIEIDSLNITTKPMA